MKLEALQVLETRRSVRSFAPQQVERAVLDTVLRAGTFAPTGGNTQEPVIIAVQNPDTVRELGRLNARVIGKDVQPYYGAPTILIVLAKRESPIAVEDGACVMCNLLNAAHAAGLGSCWIHRAREIFDSQEGRALLQLWGVPEGYMGIGTIALGYAAGEYPKAVERKKDWVYYVG